MSIVKTCKKHGDLTLSDLKIGTYKGKQYRKCKKCETERSRVYHKKIYADSVIHEEHKKRHRDYWNKNKEKIKERRLENNDAEKRRAAYKKYAPRYRDKFNKKQREYRENLSDTYMRKIIQNGDKNIPLMSIPQSLLKLKRAIMLSKRSIRKALEIDLKRRKEK